MKTVGGVSRLESFRGVHPHSAYRILILVEELDEHCAHLGGKVSRGGLELVAPRVEFRRPVGALCKVCSVSVEELLEVLYALILPEHLLVGGGCYYLRYRYDAAVSKLIRKSVL